MAVKIRISNIFRYTNPELLADPAQYYIQLAEPKFLTPTESNHIPKYDDSSGQRNGGPGYILLRPDEDFLFMSEQFETLVSSAKQGGPTEFLNTLLYLVGQDIVEVIGDTDAVLTPKQILNYQVP